MFFFFFFFNDTATTEIYTLSLHDALPIFGRAPCPDTPKLASPRRKLDVPRPKQREQQAPANSVAQRAVGLDPAPRSRQFDRQRAPARLGFMRNQFADEADLLATDLAPSIPQYRVHEGKLNHTLEQNARKKRSHRGTRRDTTPLRRGVGPIGIAAREQHAQLVREQLALRRAPALGPVAKSSLR